MKTQHSSLITRHSSFRWALLFSVLILDRLTKLWAARFLKPRFFIPIFRFFHLTYVENTGAAFGIGAHQNGFFIALSFVLLAFLLRFYRSWSRSGASAWLIAGALLIIGGALGNLYDRIVYGFVIDFLDFRIWPVFNIADSCITIGAFCLGIGLNKESAGQKAKSPERER